MAVVSDGHHGDGCFTGLDFVVHLIEDSIFSSGRLWKHAALTSKAPLLVGESDGVSHHRGGCQ